jgi:hypothetical protein
MNKVPMIKIGDCKDGYLYFIDARNNQIGIYDRGSIGFIISRTAVPLKEIGLVAPMTDEEKLRYLNEQELVLKGERSTYCCSEKAGWYTGDLN